MKTIDKPDLVGALSLETQLICKLDQQHGEIRNEADTNIKAVADILSCINENPNLKIEDTQKVDLWLPSINADQQHLEIRQ